MTRQGSNAGEVSAVDSRGIKVKIQKKHLQVNPVIDCDICFVLSPTGYLIMTLLDI